MLKVVGGVGFRTEPCIELVPNYFLFVFYVEKGILVKQSNGRAKITVDSHSDPENI